MYTLLHAMYQRSHWNDMVYSYLLRKLYQKLRLASIFVENKSFIMIYHALRASIFLFHAYHGDFFLWKMSNLMIVFYFNT